MAEDAGVGEVRAAVRLAVSRHESLRSTFATDPAGTPRQSVWPADAEAYEFEQFDREADCLAWLGRRMDVRSGWPLRVAVVRRAGAPMRLGVALHHIAADLHGFDLLCDELRASVRALVRRDDPRLPVIARQPVDLARFEQSKAGAAINRRAIAHWLRHDDALGEVLSTLRASSDRPSGDRASGDLASGDRPSGVMNVARVVARDAGHRLAALASAGRSSEGAVAVAAVACVLARNLGRTSVPLCMGVANRHLAGLGQTVSCLTQVGLINVGIPDLGDIGSVVPRAWAGMIAAMRYAHYDGDELSERMSSLDSGGRHVTAAPPSINIVRTGAAVPGLVLVPRPDYGDGERFTTWVGQTRQSCLSHYFHVQKSGSDLSIELRTGAQLLSMDESQALVADALRLIIG
jgi:hypothetical protein